MRGARRVACILGLTLLVASAPAPAPELSVALACPRRPAPGRVVCDVELEVQRGVLAWSDVLVLDAPEFAPPLRARIGPNAAVMSSEQRQRLQLALAAKRLGSGVLTIRARAVHCKDAALRECQPATREATARVEVGPINE